MSDASACSYRSTHRGTHESDLLIGGFVAARIGQFTDADLDALEEILELPGCRAGQLADRPQADPLGGGQPHVARASRERRGRRRADDGRDRLGRAGRLRRPLAGAWRTGVRRVRSCMLRATTRAWRGSRRRSALFASEIEVLRFPAWDCLPFGRVSPNPALVSERIATLGAAAGKVRTAPDRAHHGQRAGSAASRPGYGFRGASMLLGGQRHDRSRRSSPASWRRYGYGRAGTVHGAGRIRHAWRHDRRFPGGRARPGPARPVR